jgi:molecular chaperone DnaK
MYLGIDLGTTNSAIAGNTGSELRIFKTAEGADVLPSAIYIDKRGHRLYGRRAYDQALLSPDNVAMGFKRLMGTSTPIQFAGSGQSMTPEECSAEILKQLLGQAYTESGVQESTGAIVTIPAAFNQMQSEATLRAARAAGLVKVGLLQEPIAAAMAAMSQATNKSGQFLVYDLGGGTFDLALVQALNCTINILAHEGINMLGGRDFDRAIVNAVIRPWLLDKFDLPADFQKEKRYQRVIRTAHLAAEKAKLVTSAHDSEMIFASDEDIRVQDESGNDIYIEIELQRRKFEELVADQIKSTIELSRKILKDNGYSHEDIDRVVFVGGPTKMPLIRELVPQQLGVPADFQTDPMTAVALGAAIYAESRDWSAAQTTRKASRSSQQLEGGLEIKLDYPARTATDKASLRIRVQGEAARGGYEVQIKVHATGLTTSREALSDDTSVDLPLTDMGENRFRLLVFDPSGRPVASASSDFVIVRTHASAQGIPATQNIAIKVRESDHSGRNTLLLFIEKGTLLPAQGSCKVRAARRIKSGEPGHLDFELFQQDQREVKDPDLNLPIGSFRISSDDLPEGLAIRKGDTIIFNWQMNDGGILTATVDLPPPVGQSFTTPKFYVDEPGRRSFEGEDGTRFASAILDRAEEELDRAEDIGGSDAAGETRRLRECLAEQRESLDQAFDADTKRSVTEQARHLRQAISRIVYAPKYRARALARELADLKSLFNWAAREAADRRQASRFDELARDAAQEIARGTESDLTYAERRLEEMGTITRQILWSTPAFVVQAFKAAAERAHLAADPTKYQRQIKSGRDALETGDIDGLREIVFDMLRNQVSIGGSQTTAALATIMRA